MTPAAMAKTAVIKKKTLFTQKTLALYLRKTSKLLNWNTALYGVGNWTWRKANQKYLESFLNVALEMYGKDGWTDRVKNEEVLQSVKEERNILPIINKGRLTGLVTSYGGTAF